ncbi:unnamed protein product [Lathyrus sativus]|nr:unnamed protein product [Lathyrus sativus]
MKKNITKLISSLKHMKSKFGASTLLNQDQEVIFVIRVLREAIVTNISIFQSILSFLASKSKATKWLKVTKLMHKKEVSCEESLENFNELQSVEASLRTLLREGSDAAKMQATHESLEALEDAVERIENGLESVFKRLVKARVSLLNIITQ